MTNITEFTFTHHALSRALDMGIDATELRQCLQQPTATFTEQRHNGKPSDDRVYRGERIACIVSPGGVVKTVVWSTADGWRADLSRGGQGYDRRYDDTEWRN